MVLVEALALCTLLSGGQTTVRLEVNTTRDWKPISPFVYGANFPKWSERGKYLTLARSGGNRMTAYNWETNASNAGSDYFHQNDAYLSESNEPLAAVEPGARAALAAGAAYVLTVPMAGYVAADKNGGGDVNQTPDWLNTRFKKSLPTGAPNLTAAPDPNDAFVYQDQFVHHIERKLAPTVAAWKQAHPNAPHPLFYSLDNEPDLWDHTHARIRTQKLTYDEIGRRSVEYARAIKGILPQALVLGPVSYGWNGYTTLQDAPDRSKGFFLEWYLAHMRGESQRVGQRLLDVLDVHWYPEARGDGKRIIESGSSAGLVRARLQAPRSLWDPTYTEESWITQHSTQGPIRLLPRLREMVQANYAGTKIGITEYNYGGGSHISGGLAQADVLGVFGREGVFAAAHWPLQSNEEFVYGGFDLYRNYDGKGGAFGDTSVRATTSSVDRVTVYASVDAASPTRRVVVVAINKWEVSAPVLLRVAHPIPLRRAQAYCLQGTSSKPAPVRAPYIQRDGTVTATLPPMSATTFVLTR